MRNTPAGGSERVVSGTILVVSTVAASGEFDHAAITPDGEYYTPGSEIALTASAMDYSGAPAASLPRMSPSPWRTTPWVRSLRRR